MATPQIDLTATIDTTVFMTVMIMATLILLFLATYSWRYRANHSAIPFIGLMVLSAGWSLSSSLILLSTEESTKIVLQLVQYSFSILIPVMALLTVIFYIDPSRKPTYRLCLSVFILPIVNMIILITNGYHQLFFTEYVFSSNDGSLVLTNGFGPVFYSTAIYSYLAIIASTALLVRHMGQVKGIYRRRDIMVAVGIALPFIGDASLMVGITPGPGMSFAPVLLIFMGVILMFAMFRYHLFDITPIARSVVWDNTPDPSFLIDGSGRVLDANRAACEVIGIDAKAFNGASANDLFASEPGLIGLLSKAPPGKVEIELGKEGFRRFFDAHTIAMKDKAGMSMGTLLYMRDITDHKNLETAIQHKALRYRSLLDNIPLPLALIDRNDGSFVYLNPEMDKLLQGEHEQLLKTKVTDHLVTLDDIKVLSSRLVDEGAVNDFETLVKSKGDKSIWAYLAAIPITVDDQDYMLLLIRDISDRKMAESLKAANKKLSLISGITRHDLLNRFTVVGSYIQLLEGVEDKERQTKILLKLEKNTQSIMELIEFAKDYEQLGVKAPVWQNVGTVFERATIQLDLTGIDIKTEQRPLNVFADTMLEKVFYNLLENSLRHGGRVKSISLRYEPKDDGTLQMVYEDDGEGISFEDKKNLFKQGMGRNTGQGMFLTKEILQITGISIEEHGEPGRGVRFLMTVPKGMFYFRDEDGLAK
ncbi:MAG: PAS domain S-box protein [Methanomassiliicoccales archaeon]|nr:PAS domain S-box protein [Methanomassiliicoccales archaeon]